MPPQRWRVGGRESWAGSQLLRHAVPRRGIIVVAYSLLIPCRCLLPFCIVGRASCSPSLAMKPCFPTLDAALGRGSSSGSRCLDWWGGRALGGSGLRLRRLGLLLGFELRRLHGLPRVGVHVVQGLACSALRLSTFLPPCGALAHT